MTDADVRRILAIPDGVDTVEHLQRVARALADALSPLAPWPPGWTRVECEGIVAYQWQEDGRCDAWVEYDPDRACGWWYLHEPRQIGCAADVRAAIAECMAVMAERRSA